MSLEDPTRAAARKGASYETVKIVRCSPVPVVADRRVASTGGSTGTTATATSGPGRSAQLMRVCRAIQGRHSFRSNDWHADCVILPKVRDPRVVTIRRGGTLTDTDHQLLALWAAQCAEHVLPFFEDGHPSDTRPRDAIEAARAWARQDMQMMDARARGGHAMGAARSQVGAARYAAYAAGQAACVGHVPEHDLGAAAYAIKATRAAHPRNRNAGRVERNWQCDRLPGQIRALVLADQARRNAICWSVFED